MKRHYFFFWVLLAVAFAIFFLMSSLEAMPSIFGHQLKSSGMADVMLKHHSGYEQEDSLSTDSTIIEKPKFPVAVDTTAQTLLFIGDSMLDGLSPRLAAYAKASGHKMYSVIWYSSTSEKWSESKRLKQYVDKTNPSFIFICLGSNELMVKDIKTKRDGFVKDIVNQLDSIPFLWIGPPNWHPDTGINELIEQSVPEGSYFKSDGMHFERRKDGAHPTAASAALWLDSILRWMPEHSNHPLRFQYPEKKTDRPDRVFIHQPDEN